MSTETLKDFLVSIQFKTDEASQRKMDGALLGTVAAANVLAASLEKMASTAVAKVAGAPTRLKRRGRPRSRGRCSEPRSSELGREIMARSGPN